MCGGVHPLVSLFVCSVARGGDDKPITSVLLRSVGVCESGKDGGINREIQRIFIPCTLATCGMHGGLNVSAVDSGTYGLCSST